MGIELVRTLQDMPMELLQDVLGDNGSSIWKKANGIDNSPIEPYTEQKSMSQEETFEMDTIDVVKLKNILIAMTEKLCFRLRTQKRLTGCITVKIRYSNFDTHNMQCRIPYSSSDHTIIERVKELFEKLYNRRMLIRLVGVKFSHLVGGSHQVNMFDDNINVLNLYQAMDALRLRFGEDKIQRAAAMHFSLRGFNPFNGINSSPSTPNESDHSYIAPSIKSLNLLLNIQQQKKTVSVKEKNNPVVYEYLLMIPLPRDLQNKISKLKSGFNQKFRLAKSDRTEPHLMLVNFGFNTLLEEQLTEKLDEVTKFHSGFDIKLNGYGRTGEHTIYITVGNSKSVIQLLRSLQAALNLPPSQSFYAWKPNIPVARNLNEEVFKKAMPVFECKTLNTGFLVSGIELMKRSGPYARYEIVKTFELTG